MSDGWVTCQHCGCNWHKMAGGPCGCEERIATSRQREAETDRQLLKRAVELLERIARNTEGM